MRNINRYDMYRDDEQRRGHYHCALTFRMFVDVPCANIWARVNSTEMVNSSAGTTVESGTLRKKLESGIFGIFFEKVNS